MSLDFTQTNEEILNHLNEVIKVSTGKLFQFGILEDHFPNTGRMRMVADTVRQMAQIDVEADLLYRKASNGGANLALDIAQKTIRSVAHAKNWPQDLTDFILEYCLWTGPRWKHLGLPEPTLEWIREQRKQHELQQAAIDKLNAINATRNKWDSVSQSIRSKIESGLPASEVIEAVTREWGI